MIRLINREDENEPFAEWVTRHPVRWGVAVTLGTAVLGAATFKNPAPALVFSVLLGVASYLLWRNGGWAQGWWESKKRRADDD